MDAELRLGVRERGGWKGEIVRDREGKCVCVQERRTYEKMSENEKRGRENVREVRGSLVGGKGRVIASARDQLSVWDQLIECKQAVTSSHAAARLVRVRVVGHKQFMKHSWFPVRGRRTMRVSRREVWIGRKNREENR